MTTTRRASPYSLVPSPLAPYLPWEAICDEAARYGTVESYGSSVEGRDLYAVRIGEGTMPLVITAGIHGLEYIGVRTALEVMRQGPITEATLWVVPTVNPDAYARTWAAHGEGPVGTLRKNARGVDLNRNFPLPWNARPAPLGIAGSNNPQSATFRGPTPLSEPESHALARWLRQVGPHGAVGLHAFMGTLIPARVKHMSDWFGYSRLCRAFRQGQGARRRYLRLSSPVLDVFTGELEDWLHHALACWAVCIECFGIEESLRQHWRAPTSFWRFNPRAPGPIVERDAAGVRAMLVAMTTAPGLPRRPEGLRARERW